MAEYVANALQTVDANQNVIFTDTPINGNCSIIHREGSGLVTARGLTTQCRARFRATFGANIGIPSGGALGPISLAITVNGEPIGATTMIETPAALQTFSNVNSTVYIDVPAGCCSQISVRNVSPQSILVQNANLIVERVA